jgi:hypothetical protein
MATSQIPHRRRPPFPWFGRSQLLVAVGLAGVVVGSFLPWWQTFLGPQWALDTYGIWTIWAGAVGLIGALSIRPRLYQVLPLAGGLVALGIVLWVAVDGIAACRPALDGSVPCQPGAGLVVTGAAAINTVVVGIRDHLVEGPLAVIGARRR